MTAVIGAVVGLLISQGTVAWLGDILNKDPQPPARSVQEQIVDEYRRQTEEARLWQEPPVTFDASFSVFRDRFEEFDPRRHHEMSRDGELVPAAAVVTYAPQFLGRVIRVRGRLLDFNVVSPAAYPVDALLQLTDPRTEPEPPASDVGGLVYCRVPLESVQDLPRTGDLVVVRGLVVAAGSVLFAQGGFRPMAYLACSAIRTQ